MEIKDWLVLTIPIVCNGIILFLFQQFYLSKAKKSERLSTYKQDVLKQFLSYLQEFYALLRNISKIDSRSGQEYTFASLWNPTTELMQTLIVFADTHPVTIGETKLGFQKCVDKWQFIIDLLYNDAISNKFQISKKCAEVFSREYIEMNNLIKECMAACEREILD